MRRCGRHRGNSSCPSVVPLLLLVDPGAALQLEQSAGFFRCLQDDVASFSAFLGLVIYRMNRRGIPVRNPWCREKFPIIGFVVFVAGVISFLAAIALSDRVAHVFFWADLSLAAVFLGILMIGLVAGKSKDGDSGSDWGPSL